ncbi:hypothetical protein QCA50_001251 [Cerrena zonata]|uniref:Nucleolar protein 9 n=1 Tax=Cerrena zonata TaxID=2478898 RepID=A0AAW0GTA8_9APHY
MPRENRKRGKKTKKSQNTEDYHPPAPVVEENFDQNEAGPSWIVSAPRDSQVNDEAPFGYVDAEVKAYFRTVDVQIRDWQENEHLPEEEPDTDPNEDRRLFFVAALTEMSDKEKQLATDPDCSVILERMIYSMDDFARRVFVDRLSGSLEALVKHRFASHVCQTLFTTGVNTIARESKGIFPPAATSGEEGELRTLTQLLVDACEELLPSVSSLVMDSFGSHVLRALLVLLCPNLFPPEKSSAMRSKKSAAYKAKQGPLKSVFTNDSDAPVSRVPFTPKELLPLAPRFVRAIRENLSENEIRALAANQVASPVLQMLLEVEADRQMADEPGSLMDCVMAGLITALHENPSVVPEPSDYVGTLLRDPTSSHLLETLISRSPEHVFNVLWESYLKGKLARLAVHPVANFVIAKAIGRANGEQISLVCEEIKPVAGKILKSSRIGVFRALIDRVAALHTHEELVTECILVAFEISSDEDRKLVVPCILRLLPIKEYHTALEKVQTKPDGGENSTFKKRKPEDDPMEPKTQGAILLQSMLRLEAPHNEIVIDSILALPIEELLNTAYHATSSRVLDAFLDSPTVLSKTKRKFLLSLIGHYHVLVDDRIGSRVGDRCWAYADPYLKEKIARSLIPHETTLAGSFYGKFFARSLNLHLFKKNADEWKNVQAHNKLAAQPKIPPAPVPTSSVKDEAKDTDVPTSKSEKRKRKHRPEDEIDELFDNTLGKKIKRAGLSGEVVTKTKSTSSDKMKVEDVKDKSLKDILGAIQAAPKNDEKGHGKKKKRAR